MKDFSLYRLEVAPLMILPLARSPLFSYASTVPVKPGSLVSISFGRQMGQGIVFKCQALPGRRPTWMKFVTAVVEPALLTGAQCALAQEISTEYFTPLGKTLKHFIAKRVRERLTKKSGGHTVVPKVIRLTKEERVLMANPFWAQSERPLFIDTSLDTGAKRSLLLAIKHYEKSQKQVLVLVPEITLIPILLRALESAFPTAKIATLQSHLSDGAYFSAWERVRSGEARIILSTRQGLFAPFKNLGAIIVTEEQDESYKQWDMSPRYHGKRVAELLAHIHQATLILTSGTPSVETLARIERGDMLPVARLPIHPPFGSRLSVVNLRLERYRRNYSPVSEELALHIEEALSRREQILLYINRQGLSAFSVCERCKEVFRCKECDHPLINTVDGGFRCLNCSFETGSFPSCPSCGHLVFRHVGFGTEKVEREIRKRFPRARIARLDSSTQKSARALQEIISQGLAGELDIIIGTQMVLKDPPLPKLSLVAMIDADSLLLFPDFQADERLFRDISRAMRQTVSSPSGRVIVQTFHPEHAFFQKIVTEGSSSILATFIEERRDFAYPPFARFVALGATGKSAQEVNKKSEHLARALSPLLTKDCRLYPTKSVDRPKKRGQFESTTLLRFRETLPSSIRTFLEKNSKDLIIDIDPLALR